MSYNNHHILNNLDSPVKFLLWTRGEAALLVVPLVTGMLSRHLFLGIAATVLLSACKGRIRKKFGKNKVSAHLYWHLNCIRFRVLPGSYIRQLAG